MLFADIEPKTFTHSVILCTRILRAVLTLGLKEVAGAPVCAVAIVLPLLVHMQQREVVALGYEELLPGCVALLGAVRRPEEDAGHAQHGDDGQHLDT